MLVLDRSKRITPEDLLQKLKALQVEDESNLCSYSDNNYLLTKSDSITLQSMKELCSSSLTQANLGSDIIVNNSKRIFLKHDSLKFKDWIETIKQLTEVEEALSKYRKEVTMSLEVRARFNGGSYRNELTSLGPSAVASRLASTLEGVLPEYHYTEFIV